jgi:hypothetical protein
VDYHKLHSYFVFHLEKDDGSDKAARRKRRKRRLQRLNRTVPFNGVALQEMSTNDCVEGVKAPPPTPAAPRNAEDNQNVNDANNKNDRLEQAPIKDLSFLA